MIRVRHHALPLVAGLLCLELLGLTLAFQVLTSFECQATGAFGACRFLRSFVARAITILAVLGLYAGARPAAWRALLDRIARNRGAPVWALLHVAGIALMFAPLAVMGADMARDFELASGPWLAGALAAGLGALFWLLPPRDWRAWLRAERFTPLGLVALGFVIPDLTELLYPLWDSQALTRATFSAVWMVLHLIGASPVTDPSAYIIGTDGFLVQVARQCSGVEGFALVTGFTLLHGALFRDRLRFPRFWLVMLPLGLLLSWGLNVARIAMLIWIGAHVSPTLAVNGFHSYAGWMFFTLLALGLIWLGQALPWLRRSETGPSRPLASDPRAAMILPFLAFMLGTILASAFSSEPDLAYPVKVLAMAGALGFFWPMYRRMEWRIDPLAILAGVVIGGFWIWTRPGAPGLAVSLAGLSSPVFLLWAVTRVIGTGFLVPMVEELFFRGYLLGRLDQGGPVWRIIAIAVSSALFALLHGRWIAAGVAGVIFALLALRRGRLSDAIVAHMVANLLIAGAAAVTGDWTLM